MNPHLSQLHPYPFEKLRRLFEGLTPPTDKSIISLSLGEPKHPAPDFIQQNIISHLHGLGNYPTTKGLPELRQTIADWLTRRFQLAPDSLDPETQVLPVNGTREALFAFAQSMIDPANRPVVIMPNPFYQIYEGAALLAGAEPYYLNTLAENDYLPDFEAIPETILRRCQLFYICSPGNPTGTIIDQAGYQQLLDMAERYDFVIASDECYSEIYADEQQPPIGLLQAAYALGNTDFKRCVVFHSLSKRSNIPGLRSGFVAGDGELLAQFFRYRTYHGCAMSLPTQHASIAAWQDEKHVAQNRELYRQKYTAVIDILKDVCTITQPPASFYIWLNTQIDDTDFAKKLYQQEHISVLPGSYLSRLAHGVNPGSHHVRMALVAPVADCIEAAQRVKRFLLTL